MSRDACPGRQGHKVVVPLRVAGWIEDNGTKGTGFGGVGWVVVFEDLYVRAELEFEVIVIRAGTARNEEVGAQSVGDAVSPGELVQTTNSIVHHVTNHELRETFERKAMHTRTEAFLDGLDETLDLANVTVGGHDVQGNRTDVGTGAFEFVIGMGVPNTEAALGVGGNIVLHTRHDRIFGAVGDRLHRTEADVAGDAMVETATLHEKKSKHSVMSW